MRFLQIALVGSFSLVAVGSTQVFTLNPAADALLSAANPALNYGGAGAFGVAASGLPKGEFNALLRFDLGLAVANFNALYGAGFWSIQAVTLTLTAAAPNNALFNGQGAGPGGSNVNFAGQFALTWLPQDAWVEGNGTPSGPSTTGVNHNQLASLRSPADEALGIFRLFRSDDGQRGLCPRADARFCRRYDGGSGGDFPGFPGRCGRGDAGEFARGGGGDATDAHGAGRAGAGERGARGLRAAAVGGPAAQDAGLLSPAKLGHGPKGRRKSYDFYIETS